MKKKSKRFASFSNLTKHNDLNTNEQSYPRFPSKNTAADADKKMMQYANNIPTNRRLSLVMKGKMFLSWRSSKKDMGKESRDDCNSESQSCGKETSSEGRHVKFDSRSFETIVSDDQDPMTEEELKNYWYQVRQR